MSFFLEVVQSAFSPMVLFYMFAGVAAIFGCFGKVAELVDGKDVFQLL